MIAEIDQETQHNTAMVEETIAVIHSIKEDDGDLSTHVAATKDAAANEALRLKASIW
jgi:nitric oxide synthase oxygenase domain/subunit